MIYIGSRKALEDKIRAEVIKERDSKPLTHAALEYCYTDMEGKKYYRFGDTMALAIERFGKMKEYLMWIASGITPYELDKLIEFGEGALEEGIKSKGSKAAGKIGWVFTELRERKKLIIHTELLYNFLACQWVREDEDPATYNNEIQMQKVDQFKKEVASKDAYFFFQVKELKMLYEQLNLSKHEWTVFWEESLIKQEALKQMLQSYSSKPEYSGTKNQ